MTTKKKDEKFFKINYFKRTWWWSSRIWTTELFNIPIISSFLKYKINPKVYYKYMKLRLFFTKKPVYGLFEYLLTTRCTLSCKHCNSRMPLFTNDTQVNVVTFEQFKSDMDKLLKSLDFINVMGIVGGEPTLAKDLPKMIEYACSKKQIKRVFLATNCTILPSPELIKAMKHKKFAIQMSDYRNVKNIKNGVTVKYDEIKKIVIENGIRFNSYQEKRGATTWVSQPSAYKDIQDDKKMLEQWRKCDQDCKILVDGVIVPCTMGIHIYRNLEHSEKLKSELINIRELSTKELTQKLIDDLYIPYSAYCHYCHFENIEYGLPCGEQVEDNIDAK